MSWTTERELVLVSCVPDWASTDELVFARFDDMASGTEMGHVSIGRFATSKYSLLEVGGHTYCAFFRRDAKEMNGALLLDLVDGTVVQTQPSQAIRHKATWQDLGPTVGFETAGHHGPLTIHDGDGEPVAVGRLPEGMFLIWQYTPAIWQDDGRWRAAVRTVDSIELAAYNDEPPCTISVLELPEDPTDCCTVIRQFRPSPIEDLQFPDVEFGWMEHVQRGVSVCVTPSGTRLAMSEMVRLVAKNGERMDSVRLWLCNLTGTRTLVAASATHLSADYRTGRLLRIAPDGSVVEQMTARPSDAQVSPWDMLSAFSPDGKRLAYVDHGTLHIVDLDDIAQ